MQITKETGLIAYLLQMFSRKEHFFLLSLSDTVKEIHIKESLMQNLKLKIKFATKTLISFYESLSEPSSPVIRYATLFRFKRSVEVFWKLLKAYLCIHERFVCESPKSCMRMAFKVGLMDEEETVKALEMIDLKLKSEYACQEEIAEEIYRQVGDYWKLMDEVCRRIVNKVESDFHDRPAEK